MGQNHSKPFCKTSLNTLAQSGTAKVPTQPTIITGEGAEMGNEKQLKGKAKRKIISQSLSLNLIKVADQKEEPHKKKGFWNTYHCQNKITSFDGRLFGNYCKNRYCTLCSSIRKAYLINKYLPELKKWEAPYFVTLTIKACKLSRLKEMMKAMIRGFKRITQKYRKRNQRGQGVRLIGVKSLECNYNPIKATYNPHLHLIVASKEIAHAFINEWLQLWTGKFASKHGQDMRPIVNLETGLIEIIKYGSKIFTEPDVNNKSKKGAERDLYLAALYNIFDAMQGLRIFDRFGFDLPQDQEATPKGARVVTEFEEWKFDAFSFDWLNVDTDQTLTDFVPQRELLNLLEFRVNTELE